MMAMEYKPVFPRPCPSSTTTTTSSSSMKTLITLPSLICSFHGIRIHSRCSKSAAPVSCRGVGGSMMIRASKRAEEVKELRGRTTEELNEEVIDLKGELFMLRLQRSARNEFKSSEFRRMHKRLLAVFLGTYTFMFIGCGSVYMEKRGEITMLGVALAWGAAVTANIYTFGHISGAHINPAMTFAYALAGQFPWKQVPLFVIAELLGCTAASLTVPWLFDGEDYSHALLTKPLGSISDIKAVLLECIITFFYAVTSCGSRADSRAFKELGGVAVGATVFILALVAGKITGASMNPARSLGPAIITRDYHKIWIYIISPVIGAVAGTTFYFFCLMPKSGTDENTNNQEVGGLRNMNEVYISAGMDLSSINSIHYLEGKSVEVV